MDDLDVRTAAGLRVQIDRTLCVGFGDCVSEAPEAFDLDAEDIVAFVRPESTSREQLLKACETCPVDALTVWDEDGNQLVP